MSDAVFNALLDWVLRGIAILQSHNLVNLTLGGETYQLSFFSTAVSFIVFIRLVTFIIQKVHDEQEKA